MFTRRYFVCVLTCCISSFVVAGCQNRCAQPYGYPYQQPFANQYGYNGVPNYGQAYNPGVASRSQLIPPPQTGSLNIPSLARNNPFGVNRNSGSVNPNQPAPTPASTSRTAEFNQQNGWQPSDRDGANNSNQGGSQPNTRTTLGSSAETNSNPQAPAGARSVLASNATSNSGAPNNNRRSGYGASFVQSTDYATTSVNETLDRTRLPATDASSIRAPSQYYARASGARVAQTPAQGFSGAPQPYYSGTFQANQPALAQNFNPATSNVGNAIVQGQSTATFDPYGATRSADWRDQDSRFQ